MGAIRCTAIPPRDLSRSCETRGLVEEIFQIAVAAVRIVRFSSCIVSNQRNIQLQGGCRNPGISEGDRSALALAAAFDPRPKYGSLSVWQQRREAAKKTAHQIASAGAPVLHLHAVLDLGERD
jgi:hypothetical protein